MKKSADMELCDGCGQSELLTEKNGNEFCPSCYRIAEALTSRPDLMKKLGDLTRGEHGAEVVRCHGRHLTFLISRSVGCWTLLGCSGARRHWRPGHLDVLGPFGVVHRGVDRNVRVRTALALAQLPATSGAMARGEVSFAKVRALTRVATPDNETTLLAFARAGSAANLERVVRGWRTLDRRSELTAEQVRHRRRRFSAWVMTTGR